MDLTTFLNDFGKRVRAVRKAKKISQERLAELSGLHPTYISDIERGKVNASIYSCFMISNALGVPQSELVPVGVKKGGEKIENEIVAVTGLIRELNRKHQHFIVATVKGMITAIEEI